MKSSAANRWRIFMVIGNFCAYILAGGDSRRMGFNKLFLQINGQSLLERTIAVCDSSFKQVKLVAGQAASLSSFDYPIVLDSPRARGPMAGIIAAVEDCDTDFCFVTASDLLDLSTEIIESLITQYSGQQYLGLIEADGIQPLCGIYHKSSLEVFCRRAEKNEFCIAEVLKALEYSGVALSVGQWRNINRPEDLPKGVLND